MYLNATIFVVDTPSDWKAKLITRKAENEATKAPGPCSEVSGNGRSFEKIENQHRRLVRAMNLVLGPCATGHRKEVPEKSRIGSIVDSWHRVGLQRTLTWERTGGLANRMPQIRLAEIAEMLPMVSKFSIHYAASAMGITTSLVMLTRPVLMLWAPNIAEGTPDTS